MGNNLGHDHDLIARKVKLLDSLSEKNLRGTVGVYLTILTSSISNCVYKW
jgi:hypothetical protein